MKQAPTLSLKLLSFAALLFCGVSPAHAQTPEVIKIEPPSWWVGSSLNPVRVLIRGRNLGGARVQPIGHGVSVVGMPKVSESGTYILADVAIAPNGRPGHRRLKISNVGGSVEARFEILPPLNRAGRFQGFSSDDVMYLIMIDRFSDGDQSNNDLWR